MKKINRKSFLKILIGLLSFAFFGKLFGSKTLLSDKLFNNKLWQIDTSKCVQCGQCATNCVLNPSAVKCVHIYAHCGYCDLCSGYFKEIRGNLDTGAENQLCPTNAIKRTMIEDPFFEYTIIEKLCIGCGKCVKGCGNYGNGSLVLQVKQDICIGCNDCLIAARCPAKAFERVTYDNPYLV